MNRAFWRGKRVLVTGHTGFKGAWLSYWLRQMGAEVSGFALAPSTEPSLFALLNLEVEMNSTLGDVRSFDELRRATHAANPEIVFHLAAQALVREGYDRPVDTFGSNVMGTVNLLEVLRHTESARAAVVVTSDKCYSNEERSEGYRETDRLGGDDPYSSSKACAELVSACYRRSFFERTKCAVATARSGNVIGGGDWSKDRLVPDIVRAIMAGDPVRLRNPKATRPWQLALEPLAGYLSLAEKLAAHGQSYAEAWNFGPPADCSVTVEGIVESMYAAWGDETRVSLDAGEHPREHQELSLDSSKAFARLGWRTQLSSVEAVQWTADWYKSWRTKADVLEFTRTQLGRYERLLEAAA